MSHEALMNKLVAARSSWEIRLLMAQRGWLSDSTLTPSSHRNGAHFRILMKRNDWHGYLTGGATFQSGCPIILDAGHQAENVAVMRHVVLTNAVRAATAWNEFPASVPCQTANGAVVVDDWHTEQALRHGPHPRGLPTEALPEDIAPLCEANGGDALLERAQTIAALGAIYTDELSPYRWTPGGFHLDRKWGFEHGVAFPKWHGVRTDCCPLKQSTPELSIDFVSSLLEGTRKFFERLQAVYYPDSPEGELPPCLHPSPLPAMNAESKIRHQEIQADERVLARDPDAMQELARRWEQRRLAHPVLAKAWREVTLETVVSELESLEHDILVPYGGGPC